MKITPFATPGTQTLNQNNGEIIMVKHAYTSVTEVSDLLRQKKVSPVELVTDCLERTERLNPELNAFITVTADQALQDAKDAERDINSGNWKGPLHSVPVAVKDFFDTAGIKTTAATAAFENRVPTRDAEAVAKLKEAGAILLGKTNMHELGMGTTSVDSHFGAVHNPWNQAYVAGGSSGGSAAAIAAGLCFATVDTDAIGSCRLPASCCGVTGFKATYGLLSTKGILEGEEADETIVRLSHTAFQCRTVEDAALLLNALATPDMSKSEVKTDYRLAFDKTKKPTIGMVENFEATDEVREAFLEAVETFHSLGYTTKELEAPFESASFDMSNIEKDRETISQYLFKEVDVLVLPSTTAATPTIEESKAAGSQAVSADNTFFANYYGLPAISMPCGLSQNGLPLGLQIVGIKWGEGSVLQLAHAFQQTTRWHLQRPSIQEAER